MYTHCRIDKMKSLLKVKACFRAKRKSVTFHFVLALKQLKANDIRKNRRQTKKHMPCPLLSGDFHWNGGTSVSSRLSIFDSSLKANFLIYTPSYFFILSKLVSSIVP